MSNKEQLGTIVPSPKVFIQGRNIYNISSFYQEINRVFMYCEDWKIGESLDAFNDLLHGDFGILRADKNIELIWNDIELSKEALGYSATKSYYLQKLDPESPFIRSIIARNSTN